MLSKSVAADCDIRSVAYNDSTLGGNCGVVGQISISVRKWFSSNIEACFQSQIVSSKFFIVVDEKYQTIALLIMSENFYIFYHIIKFKKFN